MAHPWQPRGFIRKAKCGSVVKDVVDTSDGFDSCFSWPSFIHSFIQFNNGQSDAPRASRGTIAEKGCVQCCIGCTECMQYGRMK